MDNLEGLLGSVLSDPDAMAKLRDTAKQFGIDTDALLPGTGSSYEDHNEDSAADISAAALPPTSAGGINADMISAISKITPLLSKLNEEDDMTRLIHALRPYLSGDRRKKAEEADKIMTVMRLIPLLKNTKL
ncbi:MAG: hypothetical protein PUB37_08920 [Firmicutes bacterium]|nr:hypothetical protein [Bacillota bacterium]